MILRHTVIVQIRTNSISAEGMQLSTWATYKVMIADVQPSTLTKDEAQAFGLTDISSNTKKMFFRYDDTIIEGMRVVWHSKTFDIRGKNEWNEHNVCLLLPVVAV